MSLYCIHRESDWRCNYGAALQRGNQTKAIISELLRHKQVLVYKGVWISVKQKYSLHVKRKTQIILEMQLCPTMSYFCSIIFSVIYSRWLRQVKTVDRCYFLIFIWILLWNIVEQQATTKKKIKTILKNWIRSVLFPQLHSPILEYDNMKMVAVQSSHT